MGREARQRRRGHHRVERARVCRLRSVLSSLDVARGDETERRQRRHRVENQRSRSSVLDSRAAKRRRERVAAAKRDAGVDRIGIVFVSRRVRVRVQVQVRADLEQGLRRLAVFRVERRGELTLERHDDRHGRRASRRDAAALKSAGAFRSDKKRRLGEPRAPSLLRDDVIRVAGDLAVPRFTAFGFVVFAVGRARKRRAARGVREKPLLLALDPAIELGERRRREAARQVIRRHAPRGGKLEEHRVLVPRQGGEGGHRGGVFSCPVRPQDIGDASRVPAPRPGRPRGAARRVALPRPGRAIFRVVAEPLAPPLEGRRRESLVRVDEREDAGGDGDGSGARAFRGRARRPGGRAVARGVSPRRGRHARFRAVAGEIRQRRGERPRTPRRRRFVRGVFREGRRAGVAERCRRRHPLPDAGPPLAHAPGRHGDCQS